jgi:hypothetical protein
MYKLIRPTEDATIYGYAPDLNAGIDGVNELNTRIGRDVDLRTTAEAEPFDEPQPSRILMKFPAIDQNFDEIVDENPNVFVQSGFELADRSGVPDPQIGSSTAEESADTNVFVFFGEEVAPERESDDEEELPEDLSTLESSNPNFEPESFGAEATLRMWFVNGMGMPKRYVIEAYPAAAPWREGRGRLENTPATQEPVSWIRRDFGQDWNSPGGDFDSSLRVRKTFDGDDPDVELNVNSLFASGVENGILLKRQDEDFDRRTELKFFSKDTRTIYVPHVLLGVDDYRFEPEGADPVEKDNITAFVTNMRETYNEGSTARFNVKVEERYEQRGFLGIRPTARTESIGSERYLPPRSLTYEIRDIKTGLRFMPFDERFTAVSFANGGHFFDLDLTNLLPKRNYEIRFRYDDGMTTRTLENEQTFRVE